MAYESNGTALIDEIDRLFVVYDKAKDYLKKISNGLDEQYEIWQHRRKVLLEQSRMSSSSSSSSSTDFLLPKTQRINELSIEAVQALCRADLLFEQILRIDPKLHNQSRSLPNSTSFSTRSFETHVPQTVNINSNPARQPIPSPSINSTRQPGYGESITNGKLSGQSTFPVPVLRTQPPSTSNRSSVTSNQDRTTFKPIEQQQSPTLLSTTPRPTPIHPQMSSHSSVEKTNYARPGISSTYGTRTPQSDHVQSPVRPLSTHMMSTNIYQLPQEKVKVKLQRVQPDTKWRQAKIEVIDSLSAFYVENLEPRIYDQFNRMFEELHKFYERSEQAGQLKPLENVSIGDFGVAKYNDDNRWYRARLLTAEEHNQIKIVYIDFGNIETKYIDEFFPLHKMYTDLPAQAVACTLSEAFPRTANDSSALWPSDTIQIFRDEVADKQVEVLFVKLEEGTEQWPLHFVNITVNNQTVTSSLNLKQRIEPRPNHYIAEQLATSLSTQEFILFNVPVTDDEVELLY